MEVTDTIQDIVDNICPIFEGIGEWKEENGLFSIDACNTFYLRECKTIEINEVNYRIESVETDKKLTVKATKEGIKAPELTTFPIYKPKYFHGEPSMVLKELTNINDGNKKTPMVWLFETLKETNYSRLPLDAREKEVDIVLYIMDTNDFGKMITDDHYRACVRPMRALGELVIDEIKKNRANFGQMSEPYDITPRVNFGENNKIWTEAKTSGVQLQHRLRIMKTACIKKC